MPDRVLRRDAFGIDHYRPTALFPELAKEYSNLFYSCNTCNRLKSNFWPSEDQFALKEYIPNPCQDVMVDHMRYNYDTVEARTSGGKIAVQIMDLNEPAAVAHRRVLLTAMKSVAFEIIKARRKFKKADSVKKALIQPHLKELEAWLKALSCTVR